MPGTPPWKVFPTSLCTEVEMGFPMCFLILVQKKFQNNQQCFLRNCPQFSHIFSLFPPSALTRNRTVSSGHFSDPQMVQTFSVGSEHLFCILLHFVVFWQSMRGLVWFVFPQLLLENDFNIKKFCNFHWAKKKFHISESISLFLNSPKQCVLYFFKKKRRGWYKACTCVAK